MNFNVIPNTGSIGKIPCRDLNEAIKIKALLHSKRNIKSTIEDSDGFLVSERDQAEIIYTDMC